MNIRISRTCCLAALVALAALATKAQDVVIRRNTTTTTTTSSTTAVSTRPSRQDRVVTRPDNKSKTGTLTITSTPTGAVVKVGGKYMGETPLTLERQKPATYSVTFCAEGYETQTLAATVTAGKTATCAATLKRKQQPVQQPVQQPTSTTPTSSASTLTITANGVSFKMIRVEGGTFTMGATTEQIIGDAYSDYGAYGNESPKHNVTLSSYYIGETEVTQALWEAVMGTTVRQQRDKIDSSFDLKGVGANYPIYYVSWEECDEFVQRLNAMTGKSFHLPTEAQWEFAARGGNKSQHYRYSGNSNPSNVAWYSGNSGKETHPVKTKSPNELGLYDMSGNVYEWCQDWYDDYSPTSQTNPTGPTFGSYRVFRGGSWLGRAGDCRVSRRVNDGPGGRDGNLGFRLAL